MAEPAAYRGRRLAKDRSDMGSRWLADGHFDYPADGRTGRTTYGQCAAQRRERAGTHRDPAGIFSTDRETRETPNGWKPEINASGAEQWQLFALRPDEISVCG